MDRRRCARIRTIVFSPRETLLEGIASALKSNGFENIIPVSEAAALEHSLRSENVDLLISVSRTDKLFMGDMVHNLRHGVLERSPFPVILMLVPTADAEHVRAVINCGVDDLILAPLSSDVLLKRIAPFAQERRPFVVTHDYIGPDRRTNTRQPGEAGTLVTIPNPIRSRVAGLSDEAIQTSIDEAGRIVNGYKIERDGVQISWLVERIFEELNGEKRHSMIQDLIRRLESAAADIVRRAVSRSELPLRENGERLTIAAQEICHADDIAADSRLSHVLDLSRGLAAAVAVLRQETSSA